MATRTVEEPGGTLYVDPQPVPLEAVLEEGARRCGECTACCTVLAVLELRKPMRFACDHVSQAGCRIYDQRPDSCRQFHCGWIRGTFPADVSWRPDHLGVMLDEWQELGSGRRRVVLFELWHEASQHAGVNAWIREQESTLEVEVSHRDGAWSRHSTPPPSSAPDADTNINLEQHFK